MCRSTQRFPSTDQWSDGTAHTAVPTFSTSTSRDSPRTPRRAAITPLPQVRADLRVLWNGREGATSRMLPSTLFVRSFLQTMVNSSGSWCMPGGHDAWAAGIRGALSAERHDHLSVAASNTARVDNAAAVDGSGVGVSGDVCSDAGGIRRMWSQACMHCASRCKCIEGRSALL